MKHIAFILLLLSGYLSAQTSTQPAPPVSPPLQSCNCNTNEVQINQRLATLAALPKGGTLLLAPGVFKTSAPIASYSSNNVHIEGAGYGATVIRPVSAWAIIQDAWGPGNANASVSGVVNFVSSSHWSVKNLTIDYQTNSPAAAGNGVVASDLLITNGVHSTYGEISGIEIFGLVGHHYYIWSFRAQHIDIHDNVVDGGSSVFSANGSILWDENGIEVLGGDDVRIHANHLRNLAGAGVAALSIATVANTDINNILAFGNTIDNCDIGLQISSGFSGSYATQATGINFFGNIGTNLRAYGYYGQHTTGNVSTPPKLTNINIANNLLSMSKAAGNWAQMTGMYLQGDTASTRITVKNYNIHHNQFSNVLPTYTATNWALNGITFIPNVNVESNVFNTDVIANASWSQGYLLNTSTNNIYPGAGFIDVPGLRFNRNTVDGATMDCIELQTSADFEIKDNRCANWNARISTPGYAMIGLDGGTLTKGVISGNRGTQPFGGLFTLIIGGGTVTETDFYDNGYIDGSINGGLYATSATNSSRGTVAGTNGSATITLTNSRIRVESTIILNQTVGVGNLPIKIVCSKGSAVITLAAVAITGDTYLYQILN